MPRTSAAALAGRITSKRTTCPLLSRGLTARRAHQVRDDLTLEQVLDMLVSIASVNGSDAYQAPMLETVLDGLALPGDRGSQTV
jgi:hypothetical protein